MPAAEEVVSSGDTTSQRARAQAICLRQLAARARSRSELEQALRKREIEASVATEVLDQFTELGYIDDAAYAATLVRAEQLNRGASRGMIANRLRQRGVAEELVQDAVQSVTADSDHARARELAAKKLRLMSGVDKQAQLRRLQGFLLRRGYPAGMVVAISQELLGVAAD